VVFTWTCDALVSLDVNFQQQLENLRHALPADGRREHEWNELENGPSLRFLLELGAVLFLFP